MKEIISQIKLSLSLIDVISKHVQLERIGRNYRGLCPFHNEKTPSFVANEEKGKWKCFGCGKSGDLINFFSEINGLKNNQSIKILANKIGLNNTGRYRRQIDELAKKRAENLANQQKFKETLSMLFDNLYKVRNLLKWILSHIEKERDLDAFGEIYHELSYIEYLIEESQNVFSSNDENEMYLMAKGVYLRYKKILLKFEEGGRSSVC